MSRWLFIPAASILIGVTCLFWFFLGIPQNIVDVAGGKLDCVSYTPWDKGANPLDINYEVSEQRIREDLRKLSAYTNCIRTYSSIGTEGKVVPIADEVGLKIFLGLWIGENHERTDREIRAAQELVRKHRGAIQALIVGNEVLLRQEMTRDSLASVIKHVKELTGMPVTYADSFGPWLYHAPLADVIDFVTVHILPYWSDHEPAGVEDTLRQVEGDIATLRNAFPHKALVVGEIGWPSAGPDRGPMHLSVINQAKFVREFAAKAHHLGASYNIMEGLDQPWKRFFEGTVGGSWGVFNKDRQLKFPLQGPVSEYPDWPMRASLASVIGLMVLAAGLIAPRQLTPLRCLCLVALGFVFGNTTVQQVDYVTTTSYFFVEWIIGILGAVSTIGAAIVLAAIFLRADISTRSILPASLASIITILKRRSLPDINRSFALGILQWSAVLPAAVTSIILAISPSHRDVPWLLFWLPALAFLILHRRATNEAPNQHTVSQSVPARKTAGRQAEAWTAFVLVVSGILSFAEAQTAQGAAWLAISIGLALPWLPDFHDEIRSLRGSAIKPGSAQQGQHQG